MTLSPPQKTLAGVGVTLEIVPLWVLLGSGAAAMAAVLALWTLVMMLLVEWPEPEGF